MEKTGSTFISHMLRDFSSEQELFYSHHLPMSADCDRGKFYFISVRNPLDAYLSLYSFGCQRMGKVYGHFRKRGHADFYDRTEEGFNEWLYFVLKPKNARPLGDRYNQVADGRIAELLGFQSYRYLRLAIPDAQELLGRCRTEEDIRTVFKANKLPKFSVRHERFTEDLCRVVAGPLAHAMKDVDAALEHIRTAEPRNTSVRVDKGDGKFRVKTRLKKRLEEREWLMAEVFGY
jgi:hypothetical protein